MTTKRSGFALLLVGLIVTVSLAGTADPSTAPALRILVVDGTKTLASSMRVIALAEGIQKSGADVKMILAEGLGPFDAPLRNQSPPATPYNVILIFPRGLDEGTASRIWILSAGDPRERPAVAQVVATLRQGIDRAFSGIAAGVGPLDDLWAAFTASLYVREGWLR
jgi:hypothetical protein